MLPPLRLGDTLEVQVPIVQAPIGGGSNPALVAAVSGAGALGMLSITWKPPQLVRDEVRAVRALTDRPFGVNIVLGFDPAERLEAALAEEVALISFFWGDPTEHLRRIHAAGAIAALTVGSAAEARQAVEAGVDVVVAQGWEAGGHVWGAVATLPLVPAVVDAVRPVPVIAAGGVADGRGLAAVLCLGAAGAWLGTRFLASEEASVHADYKGWVLEAAESATEHTTAFGVGWPDAPHRVIAAPGRPEPGGTVASRADGSPIPAYSVEMPMEGMEGDLRSMALYAGQTAGLVHEVLPAAEIVRRLAAEAESVLDSLAR